MLTGLTGRPSNLAIFLCSITAVIALFGVVEMEGRTDAPASPSPQSQQSRDDSFDDRGDSLHTGGSPLQNEALEESPPERITIPTIDVDADIEPVGLEADGAMEVPDFGLAGWYTEGPKPGEQGPATVVAHVDSRSGPDVFFHLGELEVGDEVRIDQEGGSTVTFEVDDMERAPKDELPGDRIWAWTDEPTLRLITCDGLFDEAVGHYEDNLIVYLSLPQEAAAD